MKIGNIEIINENAFEKYNEHYKKYSEEYTVVNEGMIGDIVKEIKDRIKKSREKERAYAEKKREEERFKKLREKEEKEEAEAKQFCSKYPEVKTIENALYDCVDNVAEVICKKVKDYAYHDKDYVAKYGNDEMFKRCCNIEIRYDAYCEVSITNYQSGEDWSLITKAVTDECKKNPDKSKDEIEKEVEKRLNNNWYWDLLEKGEEIANDVCNSDISSIAKSKYYDMGFYSIYVDGTGDGDEGCVYLEANVRYKNIKKYLESKENNNQK